ncbi:MAG: flippase [Kiritimatiellia bacterium]
MRRRLPVRQEARVAGNTQRALTNTGFQMAGQLVTWVLSWFLLILLPRYLGDSGFGKLFFAGSYGMLFGTLINLGVNTFLTREVAILHPDPALAPEENARRHAVLRSLLGNVMTLKIALAAIVFLLQSALIYCLPYDAVTRQAVVIIGLGTCLGAITQTLGGVFQGFEDMLVPNLALIAEKTIVTGGCALLLWKGFGLIAVCWVYTAAAAVGFTLQYGLLARHERFGFACDRAQLRRIFVSGLPFLIWVIFGEIYIRIDVLMLSLMTSDAVVGWYGAATRLYGTFLFVPSILATAIFPAMMRMGADAADPGAFARASERLMNLLLFAVIPISAGAMVVARPLVRLLYGEGSFQHTVPNLQILGFSILLVSVDIVLGTVLIARGKEKPWAGMAIAAAFFNPLVNLWAIPLTTRLYGNGGIGASAATLLTEALMMVGALWLMPKGVFSRRNLLVGLKGCLLGAAMALLLCAWGQQNLVLLILAGAVFYLPLALLLGVPPREDLAHMLHALGARRQGPQPFE